MTQKIITLTVRPDSGSYVVDWSDAPRGVESYGPYLTRQDAETAIPAVRAGIHVRQAFAAAGAALYGDSWQRQLARDGLHVGERTVRRILSGDSPLQPGHLADIEQIADVRCRQILDAVATLKTAAARADHRK